MGSLNKSLEIWKTWIPYGFVMRFLETASRLLQENCELIVIGFKGFGISPENPSL